MDPAGVAAAFAQLAAAASGQAGPEDLLKHLVDIAVEHLDVDGAGVMVNEAPVGDDGHGPAGRGPLLRFVHADRSEVGEAERLQQLMQEGPCHDALHFRVDVVVDDLSDPVQTAWPHYVERALEVGLASVVAVPLISRGRVWGVLDLYRREAGTWQQSELQWVQLLAHLAASYLVMAFDRDRALRAQAELAHRSTHDALTGLPNRVLLFDRLEHALAAARRHQRVVAVFFIDLDRFKEVNDTLGHAAGDTVLSTAAERMAAALRQEDTLARLAGDEFVLLCEDLPRAGPAELDEYVRAVTARLRRALARPVRVGGADLVVSASIGAALSDRGGDRPSGGEHLSADELLAAADAAMYRAKQRAHERQGEPEREHRGGGGPEGGAPEGAVAPGTVDLTAVEAAEAAGAGAGVGVTGERLRGPRPPRHLEHQLAGALARDQLRVHYQPITDPAGTVHAVEALLRWQHPQHGLLPAAQFIDLAVDGGLIVDIGHWVVEQVCAQLARWREEPAAPQRAYVNLSARELADPALTATLAGSLRAHGLQPQQLGLELVEEAFSDAQVLPALHEQHRRGHPLCVDDFGTGYSSLSRLVELPVRMAKIDRSLVAGLERDPRRRALLDAVVTIADSLHLQVVAEGVESTAQVHRLTEAGCHYLQGFHVGPPQSAEVLTAHWGT